MSTMGIEPEPQDKPWFPRQDWLDMHASLLERSRGTTHAQVVFLGDSITQGWLSTGLAHWRSNFEPFDALNLGIGGDEVQHLHWRLLNGAGDGSHPGVVVTLIGTNNIGNVGHDAATVIGLLEPFFACVEEKWPDASKLVHTIFPRGEEPGTPMRAEVEAVNEAVRAWGEAGRFSVLDLYREFLQAGNRLGQEEFPDYLHLSEGAYAKWASFLRPAVQSLLASR